MMIVKAAPTIFVILAIIASGVGGKKSQHRKDPTATAVGSAPDAAFGALLSPPTGGDGWHTLAIYGAWNITCAGDVKISYDSIYHAGFQLDDPKDKDHVHAPAARGKGEWTQAYIDETRTQFGEVHKRGRDGYLSFVQDGIQVALPGITDDVDFDGRDNAKVTTIFQCNTGTVWRPANALDAADKPCSTTTWSETEAPPRD